MDWLATIALVADAVGNLGALTMQVVLEKLLTGLFVALFLGGIGASVGAALARHLTECLAAILRLHPDSTQQHAEKGEGQLRLPDAMPPAGRLTASR